MLAFCGRRKNIFSLETSLTCIFYLCSFCIQVSYIFYFIFTPKAPLTLHLQLMKFLFHGFLVLITISFLFPSCSTEIDLNAPPKDIWVVYGILDQSDSVQYIRVSRGFLEESDAREFAKNNDLSVQGLQVSLTGASRNYQAVQVDSVLREPTDGAFFPYTTLYRIDTKGSTALETGETYSLEIRRGDDPDFLLTSQTTIPDKVTFRNPNRNHRPGPGGSRCLIQTMLENEYPLKFSLGSEQPARGLEVRVFLDYEENGIPKTAVFGPTGIFTQNVGCTDGTGSSNRCYEFSAGEVLRGFLADMNIEPSSVYTYNVTDQNGCQGEPKDLPRALRFEVTGMDRDLANYRRINSPSFTDFNTVRPQYTNIEGPEEAIMLGLFGGISIESAIGRLSPCGEFLLNLNGRPEPETPCSL